MSQGEETKSSKKIVYAELSYRIVKILFDVYNELGGRYQEKYYQRAVAIGFDKNKIRYNKELSVNLTFQNQTIGKYFLDFLVEGKIIVELKTVMRFSYDDVRQVLAYLKAKNLRLGILVNFRGNKLEYKRIINSSNS
ncbi:MAG: GxxExxY protein [Bacteroidales bacterium]|nr:GxxExxY protein [Bacteroidales bacterium]